MSDTINLTQKDQELLTAAENRKWHLIAPLIFEGANINAFYSDGSNAGKTVLWHALYAREAFLSRALIRRLANVDTKEIKNGVTGKSLLHLAIRNNDDETAIMLINKGADVNYSPCEKESILLLALQNAYDDNMSRILIENGADVNGAIDNGLSEIAGEMVLFEKWGVLLLAIDHGLDLNARFSYDDINSCILFHAALCGEWDIVRLLLERGAELENGCVIEGINVPSVSWLIVERGPEILKSLLLNKGVDVEILSNDKKSVREYMLFFACVGENAFLKKALDLGANVNLTPSFGVHAGKTALWFMCEPYFFCCEFDVLSMMEYLIKLGANLNVFPINGGYPGASPLWKAVHSLQWGLAIKLVRAGADMKLRPTDGEYKDIHVFFWVFRYDINTDPLLIELTRILDLPLENINVTLNDKYNKGETLVLLAAQCGCWDFVIKLIKAGADPTAQDRTKDNIYRFLESTGKVQALIFILLASTNNNNAPYDKNLLSYKQRNIYNVAEKICASFKRCPFVRETIDESRSILSTRLGRIGHQEALDYMSDEWLTQEIMEKLGLNYDSLKEHIQFIKANLMKGRQSEPFDSIRALENSILDEHYDVIFSNILAEFRKNMKLHGGNHSFDKITKKNCHNVFLPIYERRKLILSIESGKDKLYFTKPERLAIYSNAASIDEIVGAPIANVGNIGRYFKKVLLV